MNLPYLFLLISLVLGALLIAALLSRKDQRQAHLFLSIAIAGGLYFQFIFAIKATGDIYRHPRLWGSEFPVGLGVPPLLYLYVLALTVPKFRFSSRSILYFVPPLLGLAWYLALTFFFPDISRWNDPRMIFWENYLRTILSVSVSGVFLWLSFRQLRRFRAALK